MGELAEKINLLVTLHTLKPIKGFVELRHLILKHRDVLDYLRIGTPKKTFASTASKVRFRQFLKGFLEIEAAVNAFYVNQNIRRKAH
jgi:hypothetical protein